MVEAVDIVKDEPGPGRILLGRLSCLGLWISSLVCHIDIQHKLHLRCIPQGDGM